MRDTGVTMQDITAAEWTAVAELLDTWAPGTATACSGDHEAVAVATRRGGVLHIAVASLQTPVTV